MPNEGDARTSPSTVTAADTADDKREHEVATAPLKGDAKKEPGSSTFPSAHANPPGQGPIFEDLKCPGAAKLDGHSEDKEILSARVLFVCLFTTLGGFIFGYDTGVIGGVTDMDGFRDSMDLPRKQSNQDDDAATANKIGWVVAILSLGCFFGAITAGPMADRCGRKRTTVWGGFTATVGVVIQATAAMLGTMLLGRFICGLGVGTLSSVVPLFNAEIAPKRVRGFLVALQQLAITFGIMIAFLCNLALADANQSWRMSLWLQAVASGVLLLGSPFLPETPRWLLSQGRAEDAVAAMEVIHPQLKGGEARAIIAQLSDVMAEEAIGADDSWSSLLEWPKSYRLFLGMGVMIGSQMTGINAIIYYAPTIFDDVGVSALVATAIIGVVNFLSTFIGLYYLDRAGRKILLVYGAAGMFISFLLIVILSAFGYTGYSVVVLVALYICFFAAGWGPTGWVYISEIFPMAGRGKAVGAATSSNWAISTILSWSTPLMLRSDGGFGLIGTFMWYSAWCFVIGVFVLFLCAETKGKSLEDVNNVFALPLKPLQVGNYKAFFGGSTQSPPARPASARQVGEHAPAQGHCVTEV